VVEHWVATLRTIIAHALQQSHHLRMLFSSLHARHVPVKVSAVWGWVGALGEEVAATPAPPPTAGTVASLAAAKCAAVKGSSSSSGTLSLRCQAPVFGGLYAASVPNWGAWLPFVSKGLFIEC
jgi:hypothetical protein